MKRLLVVLVVLVGVLVAADFGAAAVAESAVSRQMREQIGLTTDPAVRINGFPFLTQALTGEYRSVDITADRIPVGQMKDLEVVARLRDVTAPLGELLGSGPKALHVAEADGTVRIPANDLERLLPGVDQLRIETIDDEALQRAVEEGGEASITEIDPESAVRLAGTAQVLGQEVEISVIAELQLAQNGQIQIVPRDVRLGDADAPALPPIVQRGLSRLFTVRVDPGSLPLQVTPTELRASGGALEITGRATDLVLDGGAAAATGR